MENIFLLTIETIKNIPCKFVTNVYEIFISNTSCWGGLLINFSELSSLIPCPYMRILYSNTFYFPYSYDDFKLRSV